MHASGRRGKPSKPRLLYWFRTPPGVKVGREPFDETVRRTLETQHPGVVFDWKKLSNIPAAPPDVEHWRERRRAERAAKQARRGAPQPAPAGEGETEAGPEPGETTAPTQDLSAESPADDALESLLAADEPGEDEMEAAGEGDTASASAQSETIAPPPSPGSERPPGARRRRRRGGRRRRRRPGGAPTAEGAPIQVPGAGRTEQAAAESSKGPEDSSKVE